MLFFLLWVAARQRDLVRASSSTYHMALSIVGADASVKKLASMSMIGLRTLYTYALLAP
jgi:hypothetical protein